MGTIRNIPWYGWKRDLPDHRDFKFVPSVAGVPTVFDPRATAWGVYDQGAIGSCTANATISAFRQLLIKEGKGDFNGSRLAEYYWARYIEHDTLQDGGAEIRDAVKALTWFGVAPESDWPYDVNKVLRGPPHQVSVDAAKHKYPQYHSVNLVQDDICSAVYQNGNVIIGISVYDSFESDAVATTGVVPLPHRREQFLGGHALHVVGYDLNKGWAIVKNSWATDWGAAGYCFIPFSYLTNPNLAGDFWTLSLVN